MIFQCHFQRQIFIVRGDPSAVSKQKCIKQRDIQKKQHLNSYALISTSIHAPGNFANFPTNVPNANNQAMEHSNVPREEKKQKQLCKSTIISETCQGVCMCCKYPSPIKLGSLLPLLDLYPNRRASAVKGSLTI